MIHDDSDGLSMMANDIIEARMRHLFELSLMDYDETISHEEYIKIFERLFRGKRDYISRSIPDVRIWDEFGNGKVSRIEDDIIEKFTIRWIEMHSKKRSEQNWYDKYFKDIYREKYLKFINKVFKYINERALGSDKIIRLYEWFLYTYLPNEGLFYYKSAHPFDKYI